MPSYSLSASRSPTCCQGLVFGGGSGSGGSVCCRAHKVLGTATLRRTQMPVLSVAYLCSRSRNGRAEGPKDLLSLVVTGRGHVPAVSPHSHAQQTADRLSPRHRRRKPAQNDLATLSTNSVHRVIGGTTHQVVIVNEEDSAATTQAILDVVSSVRSAGPWSGDPQRSRASISIHLCWPALYALMLLKDAPGRAIRPR
jgi:hypothetical protein